MEPKMRYRKNFQVELRDVDFAKQLKLSALFTYFQDIANDAAENLGYGIEYLNEKYGIIWVLVRLRVDIERMPKLNETITIETWPLEPNKVEFNRDFYVYDENGQVIIRAVSVWVLMDRIERRLKRSGTINIEYPGIITERAIEVKLGRLRAFGGPEPVYKKTIGYSDIDFNGHLNNSKYVDYMMDCFTIEEHKSHKVTSIEVNFVHEALPGQTILLCKDISKSNENMIYLEGSNEADNKTVFKTVLHISKN